MDIYFSLVTDSSRSTVLLATSQALAGQCYSSPISHNGDNFIPASHLLSSRENLFKINIMLCFNE